MPIVDLYEHSDQKHNLAHFATLASLAAVDGEINEIIEALRIADNAEKLKAGSD